MARADGAAVARARAAKLLDDSEEAEHASREQGRGVFVVAEREAGLLRVAIPREEQNLGRGSRAYRSQRRDAQQQRRWPHRGHARGRSSSLRLPRPATTISQPARSVGRIVTRGVWLIASSVPRRRFVDIRRGADPAAAEYGAVGSEDDTTRRLRPRARAPVTVEQPELHAPSASRAKRAVLLAAILGSSIVFVDATVVNVALPAIQRDLGGGLAAQQWVVDAYLLTLGSLILIGGSLGDLFGRVRVFALGVAAFGVASALCAAAPDPTTLIVFRGVQGVAGALLTPSSLAVITGLYSGAERGAAIGTWTAWSGISTVAGPLLGGWLIGAWSWRVIFLLNVPVALVTLAIVLLAVPRDGGATERPRIDVAGAAMCALGLGGLVFGFIEQPRLGWRDPAVPGAIAGGAALLALFVVYEARAEQPMLPLQLFRKRNFSVTNVETLAVYGGLSAWGFFLALFLQQLAGYSPFRAGLATLPVTIGLFLLSRVAGRLSARHGPRWFMAAGPLLAAASVLALVRLPTRLDYWTELLPALVVFALGLSLTVAPLTATVLADAGADDAGIASGVNNAVARVAGLVAIAAVGIASASGNHLSAHGFHVAMLVTAGLFAAGGAIGAAGIRNPRRGANGGDRDLA